MRRPAQLGQSARLPYLREALTIAKFEPGMYEVVESYAPPGRSS
jgi:hypothetical protein